MASLKKKNGIYIVENLALKELENTSLEYGDSLDVDVTIRDKRLLSNQQRKFFYALCNEVEYQTGQHREDVKAIIKLMYEEYKGKKISLAKCSMTEANELIEQLIGFMIVNDIPISNDILKAEGYKFTYKQTYLMCFKRICVICGKRADIHHVDSIGMGRDRKQVAQQGMSVLPLCRGHHNKAHDMGRDSFLALYHLEPVIVNEELEKFIKRGK